VCRLGKKELIRWIRNIKKRKTLLFSLFEKEKGATTTTTTRRKKRERETQSPTERKSQPERV
jgi:hypothetical protein